MEQGELLRALVQALRVPPPRAKPEVFKAPRYSGTGSVEVFIGQFLDVAEANQWTPAATVLHLRGTLEEEARDCGAAGDLDDILTALRARFGMTPREARSKLGSLRRAYKTPLQAHATRVEELVRVAYPDLSLRLRLEMSLDYFNNGLEHTALQRHLLAVRPASLQEAVEAGNEYLRVKDGPAGVRPIDDDGVPPEEEEPATPVQQVQQVSPSNQPLMQLPTPSPDPMAVLSTAMAQLAQGMEAIQALLSERREGRKKKMVCWQCGREGHMQRQCKEKKSETTLPGNSNGQQ